MRFEKENEKNVSFFHYLCSRKKGLPSPTTWRGKSRFLYMGWQIYYIERPNDRFRLNKKRNMTVTYKKKDQTNKH